MKTRDFIKKYAIPGDTISHHDFNWHFPYFIGCGGIQTYQLCMLGRKSNYTAIHTMRYLGNKIFSVEPPYATFLDEDKWNWKKVRIIRYTKKELNDYDISCMYDVAKVIEGTPYDFGQLIDIALAYLFDYPFKYNRILDFHKEWFVCSVGNAAIEQGWRKRLEKEGKEMPYRSFSQLNEKKWNKRFVKKFKENGNRWNIESICPALYENANFFNNEYKITASTF